MSQCRSQCSRYWSHDGWRPWTSNPTALPQAGLTRSMQRAPSGVVVDTDYHCQQVGTAAGFPWQTSERQSESSVTSCVHEHRRQVVLCVNVERAT